jgi:adenylate cyclase class 2
MKQEFETKVLDIDVELITAKLRSLGAKEYTEELMKRYVFDNDEENIEFFRLREYSGKATLTYKFKKVNKDHIGNTAEIEVTVSDFDDTAAILKKIPFKRIFYQENRRHRFVLKDIEFTIDSWPLLPPFLEIEADDEAKVRKGLEMLELTGKDIGDRDIKLIYKNLGIDLHSYKDLRF